MTGLTDQQLLRDYAERRTDAAFAELVRRHVDLVYSASLRMVCDTHLAQDVTQAVFIALAQNAPNLTARPVLSGWLHRTAQNLAAKAVRSDVRRRAREQEAATMNELLVDTGSGAGVPPAWSEISPHLDAALGELSEPDRDAVLLRYFENKSLREVGQALGTSDDTAQKRVSRAVERLREFFVKRGVTVGASGLVVVISANAVQAAPVGLAVTISTAAALAGTTIAATTLATHTTMNWITVKTVGAIVAAALTAGTGTYLLQQRESNRLRSENQNLTTENLTLSNERDVALTTTTVNNEELERLRKEKSELLRLRGEVGVLRKQASEMANLKAENLRLRAASSSLQNIPAIQTPATAQTKFPKEGWAFAGYATPEAALQSWTWAYSKGDKQKMLGSLSSEARVDWETRLATQTDSQLAIDCEKASSKIKGYDILERTDRSDSEVVLTISLSTNDGQQSGEQRYRLIKVENEWKFVGPDKK